MSQSSRQIHLDVVAADKQQKVLIALASFTLLLFLQCLSLHAFCAGSSSNVTKSK